MQQTKNYQLLISYDTHQEIEHLLTKRTWLMEWLTKQTQREDIHHASIVTKRCSKNVVNVLNNWLSVVTKAINQGLTDKYEYDKVAEETERLGRMTCFTGEGALKHYDAMYKQVQDRSRIAILTREEFKKEASDKFKTKNVYNVLEFRGLENDIVILYNLFVGPVFKQMNQLVVDYQEQQPQLSGKKGRGKHFDRRYQQACSEITTAIGRAQNEICIVQTKEVHAVSRLLSIFKVSTENEAVQEEAVLSQKEKWDRWERLVQNLIWNESDEKAKEIFESELRLAELGSWSDYLATHRKINETAMGAPEQSAIKQDHLIRFENFSKEKWLGLIDINKAIKILFQSPYGEYQYALEAIWAEGSTGENSLRQAMDERANFIKDLVNKICKMAQNRINTDKLYQTRKGLAYLSRFLSAARKSKLDWFFYEDLSTRFTELVHTACWADEALTLMNKIALSNAQGGSKGWVENLLISVSRKEEVDKILESIDLCTEVRDPTGEKKLLLIWLKRNRETSLLLDHLLNKHKNIKHILSQLFAGESPLICEIINNELNHNILTHLRKKDADTFLNYLEKIATDEDNISAIFSPLFKSTDGLELLTSLKQRNNIQKIDSLFCDVGGVVDTLQRVDGRLAFISSKHPALWKVIIEESNKQSKFDWLLKENSQKISFLEEVLERNQQSNLIELFKHTKVCKFLEQKLGFVPFCRLRTYSNLAGKCLMIAVDEYNNKQFVALFDEPFFNQKSLLEHLLQQGVALDVPVAQLILLLEKSSVSKRKNGRSFLGDFLPKYPKAVFSMIDALQKRSTDPNFHINSLHSEVDEQFQESIKKKDKNQNRFFSNKKWQFAQFFELDIKKYLDDISSNYQQVLLLLRSICDDNVNGAGVLFEQSLTKLYEPVASVFCTITALEKQTLLATLAGTPAFKSVIEKLFTDKVKEEDIAGFNLDFMWQPVYGKKDTLFDVLLTNYPEVLADLIRRYKKIQRSILPKYDNFGRLIRALSTVAIDVLFQSPYGKYTYALEAVFADGNKVLMKIMKKYENFTQEIVKEIYKLKGKKIRAKNKITTDLLYQTPNGLFFLWQFLHASKKLELDWFSRDNFSTRFIQLVYISCCTEFVIKVLMRILLPDSQLSSEFPIVPEIPILYREKANRLLGSIDLCAEVSDRNNEKNPFFISLSQRIDGNFLINEILENTENIQRFLSQLFVGKNPLIWWIINDKKNHWILDVIIKREKNKLLNYLEEISNDLSAIISGLFKSKVGFNLFMSFVQKEKIRKKINTSLIIRQKNLNEACNLLYNYIYASPNLDAHFWLVREFKPAIKEHLGEEYYPNMLAHLLAGYFPKGAPSKLIFQDILIDEFSVIDLLYENGELTTILVYYPELWSLIVEESNKQSKFDWLLKENSEKIIFLEEILRLNEQNFLREYFKNPKVIQFLKENLGDLKLERLLSYCHLAGKYLQINQRNYTDKELLTFFDEPFFAEKSLLEHLFQRSVRFELNTEQILPLLRGLIENKHQQGQSFLGYFLPTYPHSVFEVFNQVKENINAQNSFFKNELFEASFKKDIEKFLKHIGSNYQHLLSILQSISNADETIVDGAKVLFGQSFIKLYEPVASSFQVITSAEKRTLFAALKATPAFRCIIEKLYKEKFSQRPVVNSSAAYVS